MKKDEVFVEIVKEFPRVFGWKMYIKQDEEKSTFLILIEHKNIEFADQKMVLNKKEYEQLVSHYNKQVKKR